MGTTWLYLTAVMSDSPGLLLSKTHIVNNILEYYSLMNIFVKAELSTDLLRLIIHHPRKAAGTSNSSTTRVVIRIVI